jgi:hypothetical protein
VAADLEHVHRGVREWDLARRTARGAGRLRRRGRASRLPPLDERLAAVAERGRDLQLLAVLPLDAELPALFDGLAPMVQAWRRSRRWPTC